MNDEHERVRRTRPVGQSDHVLGPETAPATLIEYGDYECPHCRRLHPIIQELMRRAEGLRCVYRHFPLSAIHPHAVRAAEAAEAGAAQGRFWQMHDALFDNDQPLDDERLARSAKRAGLDMERYAQEMAEGVYAARVEEDFKSALYGDGVTGTPTVYLNGSLLSDNKSFEVLLEAVRGAGATLSDDGGAERPGLLGRLRKLRIGKTRLHLR
ncbi:MAG TPA: DsbA family protein [Pyrinomonadaceae bacterium]|jgi:protein-disulfide isomerase